MKSCRSPRNSRPERPPRSAPGPLSAPMSRRRTFGEAEKLVQVNLSTTDRAQAAETWRVNVASLYERRTGPRTIALEPTLGLGRATIPFSPARAPAPSAINLSAPRPTQAPCPTSDADIAFASVTQLSRWIEQRKLTSERLTQIYLRRIEQFDPKLRCAHHPHPRSRPRASEKSRRRNRRRQVPRNPLHGIPWGGKDLLDTAGIPTTYGAEPFRNRIPKDDAAVVKRLHAAGAVLLAKLSLGALALNDIWFGGQTVNPWLLEEGASGSSAGPGCRHRGGPCRLLDWQRTGGSIISPSMRLRHHRTAAPPTAAYRAPAP